MITPIHWYRYRFAAGQHHGLLLTAEPLEVARFHDERDLCWDSPPPPARLVTWVPDVPPAQDEILKAITDLTGTEFVSVDTGSDLEVVIALERRLAQQHSRDLGRFAQRLYEQAGHHDL